MTAILRDSRQETVTFSSTVADSESVDLTDVSSGIIIFKDAPGTSVEFHVSNDNITFYKLVGADGTAAVGPTTTVVDETAVPFPDELFAAHYVKLKAQTGSSLTAIFMLKG